MNFQERFINWVYNVIIYGSIIAVCSIGIHLGVKKGNEALKAYENQEAQLQELYDNQVDIFNIFQKNFTIISVWLSKLSQAVLDVDNRLTDKIENIEKKPTYDYLKSVTLFMFQPITDKNILTKNEVINLLNDDEKIRGSVGTGVVVAEKNGFYYILTNKHICDVTTKDKCYTILDDRTPVKLEFVKQTESNYDLSLWRTSKISLPGKQVIKGLNLAYPSDSIYSVGQYLGNAYIYTEGTVGGYQDLEENGVLIRTVIENMSCTHGCSGSGVFNTDGELVGLCFAGNVLGLFQEETAKILAIDGDVIALFLKEFYN